VMAPVSVTCIVVRTRRPIKSYVAPPPQFLPFPLPLFLFFSATNTKCLPNGVNLSEPWPKKHVCPPKTTPSTKTKFTFVQFNFTFVQFSFDSTDSVGNDVFVCARRPAPKHAKDKLTEATKFEKEGHDFDFAAAYLHCDAQDSTPSSLLP
jgi:hypothetical protein